MLFNFINRIGKTEKYYEDILSKINGLEANYTFAILGLSFFFWLFIRIDIVFLYFIFIILEFLYVYYKVNLTIICVYQKQTFCHAEIKKKNDNP